MRYARKTYVDLVFRGSLINEHEVKKVKTRDISKLKVPKYVFGFRFFDILSTIVDIDGNKVELTSERINVSPMHYYGGKLYTIAQFNRKFPDERIINSSYKKIVHCGTGNWQPFYWDDIFVEAS